MKRILTYLTCIAAAAALLSSCSSFLDENNKSSLVTDSYFKTQPQIEAAVNGLYAWVPSIFNSDLEIASNYFNFIDLLTGYGKRPRGAYIHLNQANLLTVSEDNSIIASFWQNWFTALENCNSTIYGIENAEVDLSEAARNAYLGEAYAMRAYYYFNLVRFWGPLPLKTAPTTDLSSTQMELSPAEDIYQQIASDLETAEGFLDSQSWTGNPGHISKGGVKSLLAKVYLTMAGYPLQKGSEYYGKAYSKALEVIGSRAYSLGTYADLRDESKENSGEIIWSIQREGTPSNGATSPVHTCMLPYPAPEKSISKNEEYGGGMAPTVEFYNSYDDNDARKAEKAFFYTSIEAADGSGTVDLGAPYIYKWWDQNCADTGNSGLDYPIIRYADVLLIAAEAKAQADGGTTSDASAIDAYYQVRGRAMPAEARPTSLPFDVVYKERIWEFAFEIQTWFDFVRTRKALNVNNGNVVDLIGLQTPGHSAPFKESDLLFPYPLRDKRLNPNLTR